MAHTKGQTMINIEATTTIQDLSKAMRSLNSKQLPFAFALAATRMGQRIRAGELTVMRQRLHNPLPITTKSLYLRSATKQDPSATVWFKDSFNAGIPADTYLRPVVYGGQRRHKRMEKALISRGLMKSSQYAIPTPALLDAHGNVKGSTVVKILSGLQAFGEQGYTANATNSRRSRAKGNRQRFFVAEIDGTNGIWERKASGFGQAIRPVYVFVDAAPQYRVRVPFFKIAENMVKANYEKEFRAALDYAIATRR